MIRISAANPLRFSGSVDYEFSHNDFMCYFQKFNRSDSTKLQVFSDEGAPTLKIRSAATNLVLSTVIFSEKTTLIVDDEFKIYEVDISFVAIPEDEIYFQIGDDRTGTIRLAENHEGTVMIRYRNSYNWLGVVFDTDIVFNIRVEGTIRNFEPKSDDEIYTDQVKNVTKLFSLPYQMFTFFAGDAYGLPDYMADMINNAFSCDMIKIDDKWFEKVEGAEWAITRVDHYPFSGMSINIMPAINNIAAQIKVDEGEDLEPSETMIIQRYSNNFQDATVSLEVANVFEKNSVLNYIRVYRKSTSYSIKIGTTPGGNDIAEVYLTNILHTINLFHTFNEPQTIYISGLVGANDISLVWDKVDRFFNVAQSGGDPTPQPESSLGIGAVIEWHGSMVELETQFNIVTGLGREGGEWLGWAICNGENGTPDVSGRVSIGWKRNDSVYGTIGSTGGSDNVKISRGQLPNFRLKLFANEVRGSARSSDLNSTDRVVKEGSGGGRAEGYSLLRSVQEATVGTSEAIGSAEDFSIVQSYVVLLRIKKVF